MELVRLVAPLERRVDVARLSKDFTILFQCSNADTVIAMSSMHDELDDCGVWLEVNDEYLAQLATRDIKTLSTIVPLRHAVIESPRAQAHAEVVRALLTNDEVNFTNDAATIRGAYNRPGPPQPLTVWWFDGALRSADRGLKVARTETTDVGELTYFS
jgi:hypothetical protein